MNEDAVIRIAMRVMNIFMCRVSIVVYRCTGTKCERLFSSPEYAQFGFFSGTCVRLVTSCCCRVGFCTVLCVVSGVCIYVAKYRRLPFFLEAMLKLFSDYFR